VTSPTTSSPATGSSQQDIFTRILNWFSGILDDIVRLMADAEGANILLTELGWEGGVPTMPSALLQRLDQQAQGGTSADMAKVESLGELIVAIGALGDALVAVAESGSAVGVAEIVADLVDVAISLQLREKNPALWALLRLSNVIRDDQLQLSNLADIVGDTRRYLSGLVTGPGYAQTFQDYSTAIFGVLGTLLAFLPSNPPDGLPDPNQDSFITEVLYGWTTAGPADHPFLSQLLARTMTFRLDARQAPKGGNPGLEEIVNLTLVLVPGELNRGSWGLFARLSGATTLSIPLGSPPAPASGTSSSTGTGGSSSPSQTPGWQLTISSTDGVPVEILFASNGFVRVNPSGFKASVAIERPDDTPGSWVIGPASGSHVEVQHARVALTLSVDSQGTLLDVGAHSDHVIVNIALGGDSFLSSVLPQTLRMDSKIGLGIDTRRGFYLNGGVALIVDLPVRLSLGPAAVASLTIQGLHLRLGVAGADPSAGAAAGGKFEVSLLVDAGVSVAGGVLAASVAGIGAKYSLAKAADGSAGAAGWQPSLSFVPPNGLGLVVKAGPVGGGGYIGYDADRGEYTGALELHIHLAALNVDITALGMLDTRIPDHDGDWALLIILAATFSPGIQLGLGFTLSGLGGLLGINHSVDTDAIATGLRTKSLDAILFPPNPVAQAPHIFGVLRQTLPMSDGHVVVGPMLRFGWGGAVELVSVELAVLIELDPSPVQLVLLGSIRIAVPVPDLPLVRLRADLLGVLTLDPFSLLIEAALVDSKLGTFPLSGGMVLVARGGDDATFALSVGGFNPHFTPPSGVPTVDRLRVDISGSDNPRLRLEAYLAITSETFQFGARASLHAAAGPLALDAWLGLDVLIAWLPHFRFSAEVSAGASLAYDGSPVLEISLDILLEGPGPWHAKGYASLDLLFFTVSLPFDATWGDDAGPTASTAQPLDALRQELSAPGSWSAALPAGTPGLVQFRQPAGDAVPAHPLALVSCHQRVVPLGLSVTHVANHPLSGPTTVDIQQMTLGGSPAPGQQPVTEMFAAGQFLDLSDDQALSRPSFEPMKAGVLAGAGAADVGNTSVVATSYKTVAVDGANPPVRRSKWLLAADHAAALLNPPGPALARAVPPRLATQPDTLRTVSGDAAHAATAALASQRAGGSRLLDGVGVAQ
jgi:hypothetical protein